MPDTTDLVRCARHAIDTWLGIQVDIHRSRPELHDWRYSCVEELILELGQPSSPGPAPVDAPLGPDRECYHNAFAFSARTGAIYVEGFALDDAGVVYPHAWCLDHEGRAHDLTWPAGAGTLYLGVPLTSTFVASRPASRTGSALHENQNDDFQLLRHGLPPHAIHPAHRPTHQHITTHAPDRVR